MTFDPRENPLLNNQQPNAGMPQIPAMPAIPGMPLPPKPAVPAMPLAAEPVAVVPVAGVPVMPVEAKAAAGAAPGAGGKVTSKKAPKDTTSGTIDTVEAIIIALILALTFRAFVVEAFVIPTGSMAPTLLGAHFDVICPQCGYAYKETADVNSHYWHEFKPEGGGTIHDVITYGDHGELTDSYAVPAPKYRYCPNCGYAIDINQLRGEPVVASSIRGESGPRTFKWANNGDRILVLKYLYNFIEPKRWDVIVFKEPMKGQDNFIKRLIGRPGETVEIVDGDIFIADAGTEQAIVDSRRYPIARKPKWVQDTVWQLVYDNDYYPHDAPTALDPQGVARSPTDKTERATWMWTTPWHAQGSTASSWELRSADIGYTGAGPGAISFVSNDKMQYPYLTNMIGYNVVPDWQGPPNSPQPGTTDVVVKDLHVELAWKPAADAAANLTMVLGPKDNQYRFTWNGPGKKLLLERWKDNAFVEAASTPLSDPGIPQAGNWYKVEMDNADHAGHVYINGQLVLQHLPAWTAREAEAAARQSGEKQEAPAINVSVGGACAITHLKLTHDVYYTDNGHDFGGMYGANGSENGPASLHADEFFACGDNSAYSYDSRLWQKILPSLEQAGVRKGIVPRRFLLGRAFFVYWPAGFRPMNGALPRMIDPPLVPNTGEMRFIR